MTGTPASCRPRPRKGRPRTVDNAIWELDIRSLELREMFEKVGPSLRALQRCPDHRRETSLLASQIARHVVRDYRRGGGMRRALIAVLYVALIALVTLPPGGRR